MTHPSFLLGVNIDHVATLRQARGTRYPDPVHAALQIEQAGADSITLHLREDRRHIQDGDVFALRERMLTKMNLEMAVTDEMIGIACKVKPDYCCLVPERREELTTEGGLDVLAHEDAVRAACDRLGEAGIRVSLFIDADPRQIEAAQRCGAPAIEIHTGHYADAASEAEARRLLTQIHEAARVGDELGLQVNAGHGLNRQNLTPVAANPLFLEFNIGHAIIADAVFMGLEKAIRAYRELLWQAREA